MHTSANTLKPSAVHPLVASVLAASGLHPSDPLAPGCAHGGRERAAHRGRLRRAPRGSCSARPPWTSPRSSPRPWGSASTTRASSRPSSRSSRSGACGRGGSPRWLGSTRFLAGSTRSSSGPMTRRRSSSARTAGSPRRTAVPAGVNRDGQEGAGRPGRLLRPRLRQPTGDARRGGRGAGHRPHRQMLSGGPLGGRRRLRQPIAECGAHQPDVEALAKVAWTPCTLPSRYLNM
jgi:hypothetical protein